MIRSNQKLFNFMNILSDGVLIFISFLIAYLVRFYYLEVDDSPISFYYYVATACSTVPIHLTLYMILGLYKSQRKVPFYKVLWNLTQANVFSCIFLLMGLYLLKIVHVSRLTILLFLAFEILILGLKRFLLLKILYHYRKQGYNQKHILLVGSGILAHKYLHEIHTSPELGYDVIGYVGEKSEDMPIYHLGEFDHLIKILEGLVPDEVVVAMSAEEYVQTEKIIHACEKTGTKMSMIPFYTQYFPSNPQVDFLNHMPMLQLRPIPLENFGCALLKRMVDVVGSLLLILLTAPLMGFVAIGVKCTTKGSVIFKQIRIGKDKQKFLMYKFRSMSENTAEDSTWTTANDPRKTKFGSFIRKFSLDELPQLFNVLRGEMSLIGPRPEIPFYVEKFKEEIPHYMVKHQVRPGMTGWAQVSGFRGDTSIPSRIIHDIYYIEHWTLFFDLKILWLTLWLGFMNEEKLA